LHEFPLKDGPTERILNDFSLLSRFEELLLAENFALLTTLLKIVSSNTKEVEQLSRASLQVLTPRQAGYQLVARVMDLELKALASEPQGKIADSLPISIRLASGYLNSFGADYLRKILMPVVNEICLDGSRFEVDPYHLGQGENARKNMEALVMASYQVIGCIVNSLGSCPG